MNARITRRWVLLAAVGLSAALAPNALAHAGHSLGTGSIGLLHFATSLSHGAGTPLVAVLFALAAGIAWLRRA